MLLQAVPLNPQTPDHVPVHMLPEYAGTAQVAQVPALQIYTCSTRLSEQDQLPQ